MKLVQSNSQKTAQQLHVAIIMDGNGRWAIQQGQPRIFGHRTGAETARSIVEKAPELGVSVLTLYAFSSDNWGRPENEVRFLMRLLRRYIKQEIPNCLKNDVRLGFIGRRDRLDAGLQRIMKEAEDKTINGNKLYLRVAIDYSARDILMRAARLQGSEEVLSRKSFQKWISKAQNERLVTRDVDLLIRTGGEQRLSDFLLWECAYAEFYFTQVMWPEFTTNEFEQALSDFVHRDRRFGRIKQTMVAGL